MDFNRHLNLAGTHAFLSPSNYHWVNYDEDKLDRMFVASLAAKRGTELHALAHECIRLGVKLPDIQKTLNQYVNDGIGYKMTCEQVLFYSINCYGSADTISFRHGILRIHDYKSGVTPASPNQLEIYAALFCLEYDVRPFDIQTELRIYQSNEVLKFDADPDSIFHVMDRIKTFDKRINAIRMEAS